MSLSPESFRVVGRLAVATQGCKVNQYDTQVLLEEFLARGWELVPFGSAAELTVINSCTVTSGSDRDLRHLVHRARRAAPEGRILVTGCRAQVDPAGAAALDGVDFVVDNLRKDQIPRLAATGGLGRLSAGIAGALFPDRVEDAPITRLDGRGRAILKIQDGCNLRCSFCVVPLARGASRSRAAGEVLLRARALEEHGYREVVLSGIQLGFYADPDGRAAQLSDLLRLLLDGTRGLRFRLSSLLPRHVTPALRALFAQERARLCPHFHLSLQSGDDGILRAMKRPYRRRDYRALVETLAGELDDPCFGTDLIVGFPGEDVAAFDQSLELVAELPLAYGHVFPFSPRPGTGGAALGDPVPAAEKARRSSLVRELLAEKGRRYRERQMGRRLNAIMEKRRPDGLWQGTSENYQRLLFSGAELRSGELAALEVNGIQADALLGRRLSGQEARA